MANCSNCVTLAGIIQKQDAEIRRLKQTIEAARVACNQITAESSWVMSQHGSPYKYNLAKGARDAAASIERKLR